MNKLSEVMSESMAKIREMVDANTIVGQPITTPDGVTLIPISKVSFGFGSGGGDYGAKPADKFGGAGAAGVRGALAKVVDAGGGKMLGVAPGFFDKPGVLYQQCDEMVFTETMRQRKQLMEDESDAFVMTPGGLGTMEEFFEIITLRQLGQHTKPVIILNLLGYYDPLIQLITHAIEGGFARQCDGELFVVAESAEQVIEYLNK